MDQEIPKKKIKLRQLNIAVLGPYKQGKTSLVNWLTGIQDISKKSHVIEEQKDQEAKENIIYQTQMVRQHHYIYHKNYHINIFDLPSSSDYVMISNTLTITNVIFVVSAIPNVFNESLGEIKEILKRCELLNVKRILFAVNFMDVFPQCNWSIQLFNKIVSDLKYLCQSIKYKKEPLQTFFVPTSALQGENILRQNQSLDKLIEHGVCKWVQEQKVPCLLEGIEQLFIQQGKTKTQRESKFYMKQKPLRFSVIGRIPFHNEDDYFECYDEDEQPVSGVFVYIHSGKVRKNTKLLLQPKQTFAIVKRVAYFLPSQARWFKKVSQFFSEYSEEDQNKVPTHASAGSLCYIFFHNEEKLIIPLGTIGGEPVSKKIPQEAASIICKIKLTGFDKKILVNRIYECLCGFQKFRAKVSEIISIFDNNNRLIHMNKNTNRQQADDNKLIYQVRLILQNEACLERFQHIPILGQIFIFWTKTISQQDLIAIARIEEVALKYNSIDHLPRVFAVPKSQLIDPITNQKRDDWDVCQVDLVKQQDTLMLPCGHLKLCQQCTSKVQRCPFCKIVVQSQRKMQAIMLEDDIDLMEYALCDQCVKNRISHAVMDCDHYQCLCELCVDKFQKDQSCQLCNKVHLIVKIYI